MSETGSNLTPRERRLDGALLEFLRASHRIPVLRNFDFLCRVVMPVAVAVARERRKPYDILAEQAPKDGGRSYDWGGYEISSMQPVKSLDQRLTPPSQVRTIPDT